MSNSIFIFNEIKEFFVHKLKDVKIALECHKYNGLFFLGESPKVLPLNCFSENIVKESKEKVINYIIKDKPFGQINDIISKRPKDKKLSEEELKEIFDLFSTERSEYLKYLCKEFNQDTSPIHYFFEKNKKFGFAFKSVKTDSFTIYENAAKGASYVWNETEFERNYDKKFDIEEVLTEVKKGRSDYCNLNIKGFVRIYHSKENIQKWRNELNEFLNS